MKLKFEPENFAVAWCAPSTSHKDMDITLAIEISKVAQAIFDAWYKANVEDTPVVVCRKDDGKWACDEHVGFARATHKARLVGIEKL